MSPGFVRLLFLGLLFLPALAQALTVEAGAGERAAVNLAGHLSVRCTDNPDESIAEVAAPEQAAAFTSLPALLLRGYTSQVCWLRFSLQRAPGAARDWLLELGPSFLDNVVLYVPSGDTGAGFSALALGDRVPYEERPVPHRRFVFPIPIPDGPPTTYFLRLQTSSTMLVDSINLWQYPGLIQKTQREGALYWGVSGLIALGALSNLVFWFWLRERVYRLYTLYLAALLLLTQSNSGLLTQWLLPSTPIVADRLLGVATSLTYLIGLLFFNEVLGLRRHFVWLGRIIPVVVGVYLVTAVSAAAGHYDKSAGMQQTVALVATLAITVAGPWLIWRGVPNLRLYTAAFATQLATAAAVIGRNLGLWATTFPLDDFILAATTVHVVLLNFVLAERVRRTQQEKAAIAKNAARLESEQLALVQQQEFMSMVAHEFRTPLAIIDTSAQRLAGNPQADRSRILERCHNIRAATRRMTALMDEFLALDRMEGELRGYAPVDCNPEDLVIHAAAEHGDKVTVHREGLPDSLRCDAALVGLALSNLLANALRYAPPDQPVRFSARGGAAGGVDFTIEDSGPGVPADELPRLFQKYFRGRAAKTQPGAGLGLYLVQRIAEMHGGTVTVHSTPGEGCRFILHVPGRA